MKTARFWEAAENSAVRCVLCPHRCRLAVGARSRCFGRVNHGGTLMAETWGQPMALQVDPIEKKPLYHFLPGSRILSVGTLGCNLACQFCQNWELSHPTPRRQATGRPTLPEEIVDMAVHNQLPAIAATYNEPAVWAEYALDIAAAAHARGIKMVAVTAGYFSPESRGEFFGQMDAANVDLKSLRDDFYRRYCGARLTPVLDTLLAIRQETSCWLELTTLLIPGLNDSDAELDELTKWVTENLGPDVPQHFSAFHPAGERQDLPSTPLATLRRAERVARANGLRHAYLGNVVAPDVATTRCASCGATLITRDGFAARSVGLDSGGSCRACGTPSPGVW